MTASQCDCGEVHIDVDDLEVTEREQTAVLGDLDLGSAVLGDVHRGAQRGSFDSAPRVGVGHAGLPSFGKSDPVVGAQGIQTCGHIFLLGVDLYGGDPLRELDRGVAHFSVVLGVERISEPANRLQ